MDKIIGWFAKLLPLLVYYPRWVQIVFTTGVAGVLITMFFLIVLYPAAVRTQSGAVDDATLPTLIKAAREAKLDYVIESVTELVNMSTTESVTGQTIVVDVNMTYVVFALNHATHFDEEFHGMSSIIGLDRIHGADPEGDFSENSPYRKAWNVNIELQPGKRQSISTGARYTYISCHSQRSAQYMTLKT